MLYIDQFEDWSSSFQTFNPDIRPSGCRAAIRKESTLPV